MRLFDWSSTVYTRELRMASGSHTLSVIPVTEIGHKVGAALVGTFLGILLSYGFAQPVATIMEHRVTEELGIDQCIKAGILAIHKGFAPAIAVEFARRVVPDDVRPTFEETEKLCRGARSEAAAQAAAA